jgi:hypothetical protein
MIIHPRLLPKNGGTNRSINGDHRNLKAYGNPTRENNPIVLISTPSFTIHAESVEPVRARGIPDAKPRTNMRGIFPLR